VVRTAVSATDKTEFANAKLDGPVVLAPTATAETPHPPTEPPLDKRNALSAHTVTKNAVELTVEPATNKLENALARTDGPEVPALDVTAKSELPPTTQEEPPAVPTNQPLLPEVLTNQPPETTDALTAHTRTLNAVEKNVVIATEQLEHALARTDGPEVLALPVTENLETSPTEARLLNAQCAHTREPSAVEVTVETATDNLENASARTDGPEVLARTKEESLELDTLALTRPMPTLLTQQLPATWDLSGLLSSESSPPSAPFSSWSWSFWLSRSPRGPKRKLKQKHSPTKPGKGNKKSERLFLGCT